MKNYIRSQSTTHIAFDLDSTLATIEGIDELAKKNGFAAAVAQLTKGAMAGQLPLEDVFTRRLALVQPARRELHELGNLYCQSITKGARTLISILKQRGARVYLITSGMNPAVATVATRLGIPRKNVFANELFFDPKGVYKGFDRGNPLVKNSGKVDVLTRLRREYPGTWFYVGDSMSDWESTRVVDRFICFAGVRKRPHVIARSQFVVTSPTLLSLIPILRDFLPSRLPKLPRAPVSF